MREFLNAKTIVVADHVSHTQPSLFEQPKAEPRSDKPSEFLQIADQLRRFEPRKASPLTAEPTRATAPTKTAEPIKAPGPANVEPAKSAPQRNASEEDDDVPPSRGSILGLR
jgi:hypothetical protein